MTTPLIICDHSEDANPRHKGRCGKCSAVMPQPAPSTRDPAFEDEMLELALEGARRFYHHDASHFAHGVKMRLALGDERHRGSYLDRDCLAEAVEEPVDAAAWLLLDLQKLKPELSDEDFQQLKMAAAPAMAASAAADAALEQYRVAKGEVTG